MKSFCSVLLGLSLAVFSATAMSIPSNPEFAMVPTMDGNWVLVNVNEDPEPESFFTPENDIVFTLFTNRNRDGEVIQWNSPSSIANSNFNPAYPTRLTIHGWNGDPTSRVNTAVRAAYLDSGMFNVIMVDWSRGAGTINYLSARNRVGPVGVVVAGFLRNLVEATGADLRDVSLIGHSLGAHVAGFTGKNLDQPLGSIVGLDAASPRFSINRPDERLNPNDALYVQTIHTNAGTLGFDQPIGDGSFYPNGGSSQPGCGIDVSGNCAHGRSHEFFAESIRSYTGFWSTQCRDYTDITRGNCVSSGPDRLMGGEPLDTNAVGVFFLTTNRASPFARGPVN